MDVLYSIYCMRENIMLKEWRMARIPLHHIIQYFYGLQAADQTMDKSSGKSNILS